MAQPLTAQNLTTAERARLLGIPSHVSAGGLEAIPAMGSALLGSIPAGLHGLATLAATRDVERAAAATQGAQQAMTYQPRTQAGQEAVAGLGAGLGMLGAPSEWMGQKILEHTGSPGLATAGELLLDPLDLIPGAKALGMTGDLAATLFHGSPHKFDKFEYSPRTESTGEGVQAYGSGLYFAENPEIARHYRDALSDYQWSMDGEPFIPGDIPVEQQRYIWPAAQGKLGDLIAEMEQQRANMDDLSDVDPKEAAMWGEFAKASPAVKASLDNDIANARAMMGRDIKAELGGSFYTVDFPDDAVDKMIDLDTQLSGQSWVPKGTKDEIVGRVKAEGRKPTIAEKAAVDLQTPGSAATRDSGMSFYKRIADKLGSPQNASMALRNEGIPGLKFLDATSRLAGDGSRNMVVFDDALLNILSRE